ncbi:hypothetical protein KSS87_001889 [Heliosperma pusillum]|nr:hypothetical protein KSS87_015817 [Heliosperma pusillum]KAH9613384.1 hypothetical protein KSS87_001889 [Heliosperma pusillum]
MQTMGNEESQTYCSHKELHCKQWVMKENSFFIEGVTKQTMGNEERLIIHTMSYNANNG